ncbi:histidine kinase [Lysobacteraceae bacterium NML93-0792]|nr:histidine kinase [Xanthomonadaceae bacterium NML93-0792]PBS16719.1 histidine kinase [Xanthomonadaceae bacterium NML93-0793]PBS19316.1 histidine kinase [Xanthomonadaceae bacterium NML93-0831]
MRCAGIALVGLWLSLIACTVWAHDHAPPTAGNPQPRQIGVLDGLPSSRVHAIAEDRQGYLWIATRDGLARYDGVGFRVWRTEDGLHDNSVWSVHVDARDRVWIGTSRGGVSMLDVDRTRFTHYTRSSHPEMGVDDVWAVTSTPDGAIWFGTAESGLYRIDDDGYMQRFRADPADPRSLPGDAVGYLVVQEDGTLWVGCKTGVAAWTGQDFAPVALPTPPGALVEGLTVGSAGELWIGVQGRGVIRHPDGRTELIPLSDPVLGEPVLHMLAEDRQGARWYDSRSGLAREIGGRLEDVPLYSVASRGAVRPAWASAFEDREGGLWFASNDTGLWYLPANWRNFTVLQRRISDPATLGNAIVNAIAPAADGGLWLVGSGGALDHLDPRTGRIDHRLTRVCGTQVSSGVVEMTSGVIWVACMRHHLVRYDPATGERRAWNETGGVHAAPSNGIAGLVEAADGVLWIADSGGLQARAADGDVIVSIRPGAGHGLPGSVRPTRLVRGPDGGVWLATTGGLFRWNGDDARFQPVPGGPQTHVSAIGQQGADTVWLTGMGQLDEYRWDGTALVPARRFDADDGLPQVFPGDVRIDADGAVWLTTVRGLLRLDPETSRIRVYGVRDGLLSQEFNDRPMGVSRDGHFAAGTGDGLLLFHPLQVRQHDAKPPLLIGTLEVRRGDDVIQLPPQGPVRLQHGDRDLRVVARLLSFTDAHAHRYRLRLDGYETDWVNVNAGAVRRFPRLAPGRYTLEVEARTESGDWIALAPLAIHQAPPWWRTVWAWIAALVLLALGLWRAAYAYRGRLRRRHAWQLAEEKRELAEHASQAKTRFLATLGHEVRTPMTGVLGMSELLLDTELDPRQRDYTLAIRRAGDHLMRLVNDALDLARIEAGKLQLDPQTFDLHGMVQDIVSLCAPMARQKALDFDVTLAPDTMQWVQGDPTRVRQILLNLIGNALKFTDSGRVALHVERRGADVVFTVSDTGPGLSAEQVGRLFRRFEQADGARTNARYGGSGLGLAISQELSAAMGGRIDVDSTLGQGTRFDVRLPLVAVDAPPVASEPASHARLTAAVGLDILLVEDDQTVADVISGLLQAQGHTVVHALHGLAALTEVAARTFDIALLDLDLPGVDGLALAGMLRALGFHRPLVAVTARADADAEPAARTAGFEGFLRKPLTGEMLADVIAQTWRPARSDDGIEDPS